MTANSPRSRPVLKSGTEPFHAAGQPIGLTLVDYWRWSASDLLSNTQRGVVAEYLVVAALGTAERPRDEWVFFNVVNQSGLEIEVQERRLQAELGAGSSVKHPVPDSSNPLAMESGDRQEQET